MAGEMCDGPHKLPIIKKSTSASDNEADLHAWLPTEKMNPKALSQNDHLSAGHRHGEQKNGT
jgi:hypothetical protein